ncbi:MAG: hypothetical protein Q8Q09_11905 [Deltaproteobacteria bacterium]|nr:hypothetical protein [Deltaproteobacteria bacterium]
MHHNALSKSVRWVIATGAIAFLVAQTALAEAPCPDGMVSRRGVCEMLIVGAPQGPQRFETSGRSATGWRHLEISPFRASPRVLDAVRRAPF